MLNAKLQEVGVLTKEETLSVDDNQMVVTSEEAKTSVATGVVMLMLLLYVIMNAAVISSDWINFKKSYVLKRSVVSPRSNMEIILSFLLAYFVFIFAANMALMAVMHLSGLVPEINWGVFTSLLAVTIIYSLCLNLFFFRIFKVPGHATTFGILFVMLMAGIGMPAVFGDFGGSWLSIVAYISPVYWLYKAIDLQTIFPAVWVILAMAGVYLTAGSYRLEQYVQNK